MKIVCDACSAKYSIADDKVKGKVFKIRCKKCSNIIVVRGTAGASDEPPAPQFDQKDTRVYDYGYDEGAAGAAAGGGAAAGEEPVWHLVIDQEQVGPLTVAEVQDRFQQGQIDSESYVWREGFGDWQPLASVDVFAHLAAGGGGGGGAGAVASMFGGGGDDGGTQRSNPDDLFAAAARGGTTDDAGDDAGDLFGARAAAAPMAARGGGDGDDYDKPVSKGGAAGGKLRGERNENSVLFSLGNLAALASDSPRASAASSSSSSSSSGGGAAQHGGGEGSGLIDIRSMASAYLGPQGAQKKQQSSVGSIDDLPVFSATAFSEPAVIMPAPAGRQNNKTMVILMAAVAALAVITLVLVLVVVLGGDKGGSTQPPEVASKTGGDDDDGTKKDPDPEEKKDGVTPPTDGTGPGTAEEKKDGVTPPTDGTGPGTATEEKKEEKKDDKKVEKKDDRSSRDSKKDDKKEEKKVEEKKEEKPSGNCPDEVGCLLSEKPPACCSKYSKGGKKKEEKKTDNGGGGGGGDLPESIDSDMVKSGVGKVKSKIFACGDKYPSAKGTLKLSVKVNAGGSVTDVSVVSSPDSGLGSCAASAMKGAKFPKTQRGGSFKYPFNF